MAVEKAETIPTVDHKPHAAFFRQSGWLMISNIAGGVMTLGVHPLSKHMSDLEYTAFGVLLTMISFIPTMPLQMVFAQQSALALATGRERQLASMIRKTAFWIFIAWVLAAAMIVWFRSAIASNWQLPGEAGLLIAVPVLLLSLWSPLFGGVMQGRQDFFWVGWSSILGGTSRLFIAAILVLALNFGANGMLTGVLVGVALTAVISIWRTRDLWTLPAEKFDVKELLKQVVPLIIGFGACQFMFTADTMYTKAYFSPDAMKPYVVAGVLSRGILLLVMPLATVMFPKIVQSNAKKEKSNLFGLVVIGTAVVSLCGMIGLWVFGPLAVKILFNSQDVSGTMALIPWYAGAMVPLAMANVMVNDLLARLRFGVVPFMVLLALAYGLTLPWMLSHHPGHIEVVLQTLGTFNLALFGVCAWFVWGIKDKSAPATAKV